MVGYVYILRSLGNGKYYIGNTQDIVRRIHEHELGKSSYVSRYIGTFELVFCQQYIDIGMARKAEKWLKLQKDRDFIERVIVDGVIKKNVN